MEAGNPMSYRTHCDWCGGHLAYEEDRAVMPVTIYHRKGRGSPEAKWIEETCVMRHFCVAPTRDDGDGPSRAELAAAGRPDTCYDRAIAAITGTKLTTPAMGMEWRMMPVDDDGEQRPVATDGASTPATSAPAIDLHEVVSLDGEQVTRELRDVIVERLPPKGRHVLPRAGIASLDQVAAMTDDELLAIDGIGRRVLQALRQAVSDRGGYDGLTLARRVYELLQAGLPRLDEQDPVHAVLADALPSLAAALGERA
jgi:hypothetical protein